MEASRTNSATASKNSAVTEFLVDGMTCQNCVRHVTDAIQDVPGVRSASVSLKNKNAAVRWNSGAPQNISAVIVAVKKSGYEAEEFQAGDEAGSKSWQINLWLGISITIFLMVGEWLFGLALTPWFQWLSFALAGVVQIFCGAQFYRGAWNQLKVGGSNMDTLVALGSTTAFGFSCRVLFAGAGGEVYFMEAAAIITLISLGHWLEARVGDKAGGALKSLLNLAPQTARRIQDATPVRQENFDLRSFKPVAETQTMEVEIPVSELKIGDRIALRPGDRVPVDGIIAEGGSAIDESMLTGESVPLDKKTGGELFAGTMNLNGRLVMRVTATGENTALANIIAAVQRAQTSRADIQRLGDRVSNVFVPVVVAIAVLAGLWWGLAPESAKHIHDFLAQFLWPAHLPAGAATAFMIAAAILIVACPCAMGLATPAAIMAGANAAARRGILIRDGVALEKAGKITAVVFDKTGTLTSGELAVAGTWTPSGLNETIQQAQKLAGAMARSSNHPISKVLANFSDAKIESKNWQEISGSGVQGKLNSEIVRLGSLAWFRVCDLTFQKMKN